MAKDNNLSDFLLDLANIIRSKTGASGDINPQDFSQKIKDIPTGSAKTELEITTNLMMERGDQTIAPEDSATQTMSKVIVKKPETLISSNIRSGVEIGGVVGDFTGEGLTEKSKTEPLNMSEGNQIINPDAGTTMSQVTIIKPDTFIAENIKKDVNIGGIIGTLEMGGIDTSDATATSRDILQDKTAYAKGVKLTGSIETYDGTFVINPYKIITNLTNMVADPSNATTIKAGESITLKFIPTGDHIYPYSVAVTGATSQYDNQNGYVYLSNATSDVTVTINATQVGILGRSKIKFKDRLTKPSSMVSIFVNGTDIKLTDESYSGYYIAEIEMSNSAGWLTLRTRNPSDQLGVNGIVYSTDGFTDGNTGQTYAANQWVVPAAKELVISYNPLEVDQSDLNWLKANATITKL